MSRRKKVWLKRKIKKSLGFILIFVVAGYFYATTDHKFYSPISENPVVLANSEISDKEVLLDEKLLPTETPTPTTDPYQEGYAKVSYYIAKFDGINCDDPKCITASGEAFDENADTLACPSDYPLGTKFAFDYNGKTAQGRCNDRGGFEALGRKFDLSKGLFKKLAPEGSGVVEVYYKVID